MIAGTHVTVEEVLKELASSEAVDVILTAHPELDRDAVQAALEYAAAKMHSLASAPVSSRNRDFCPPDRVWPRTARTAAKSR